MPSTILDDMELNRSYRCGCLSLTPAPKDIDQRVCPSCLVKENEKINSNKTTQ